jgi:hypothetical protein
MPTVDMNNAIRSAVAQEVTRILGPHLDTLQRLSRAMGVAAPQQARSVAPSARAGRPRRAAASSADATGFQEGQRVIYRQGRGSFEATVMAIDSASDRLTLKREKDGKRVARPAAKVFAA